MPPDPPNAFARKFRRRMSRRDEPATGHEAATAGPAQVVPTDTGWAVLLEGESLDEGDRPAAVLTDRSVALLVAAALPASGREPTYHLDLEPDGQGYPLRDHGRIVGRFSSFNPDLLARLNSNDGLVRSPHDLALVLEGSGGLALERAGRILERQTRRPQPENEDED